MNWHLGLQRISAVFWGFWAVLIGGISAFSIFEQGALETRTLAYVASCLIAIYLFYRITNWIIGGFFSKK